MIDPIAVGAILGFFLASGVLVGLGIAILRKG